VSIMKQLTKIFLFILFCLPLTSASAQEIEKWKIEELEAYIKKSDKPLIINFWATFCKPCLQEIPYFQALAKKYEKEEVTLLLVSLDMQDAYLKIKGVAAKHQLIAPIIFLNETNADIFCPRVDAKWSGAIPASLFVNNKTGYRKFFEEQIPENKLEEEIKSLIAK
jgi:thiol-disulfide isomerase/thioredoxin